MRDRPQDFPYYDEQNPNYTNQKGEKKMFSLEELFGQQQGNDAVGQISQMLGANQRMTSSAIHASTPQGAANLNTALAQHHKGGLLNNLMGYLGGGLSQP